MARPDAGVDEEDAPAPATVAYGDCDRGMCSAGLDCVPFFHSTGNGKACLPSCDRAMMGADCLAPPAPGRAPLCIEVDDARERCLIPCRTDGECPAGMFCWDSFWCVWPP
jgi:hypothetical protein